VSVNGAGIVYHSWSIYHFPSTNGQWFFAQDEGGRQPYAAAPVRLIEEIRYARPEPAGRKHAWPRQR
jgi:hypothetical protein